MRDRFNDWVLEYLGDDEFVMLIVGGSVAGGFHHHMRTALEAALGELVSGWNVTAIQAINGGDKQPHQLLTVQYLLASGLRPDVVINIDGFNEAYIGLWNWHYYCADAIDTFVDFAHQIQGNIACSAAATHAIIDAQNDLVREQQRISSARLAIDHYYRSLIVLPEKAERLERAKTLISEGFKREESQHLIVPSPHKESDKARDGIVELWVNSSVQLRHIVEQSGGV